MKKKLKINKNMQIILAVAGILAILFDLKYIFF